MKFNFSQLNNDVKKNNKRHMKLVVARNQRTLARLKVSHKALLEVAAASASKR